MEEWKTIEFLDNKYSISNLGRVKSNKTDRILKTRDFKKTGYQIITLTIKKKVFTYYIHRLILLTFKPIDNPDLFDVDHIDMDRTNNKLENLRWLSGLQNSTNKKRNTKSFITFSNLLLKLGDKKLNELLLTL